MKEINDNIKDKGLQEDERISSYIRGEMTESEENQFMNDLQSDDDLRSKAVDIAYLTKALKDVGKVQDANVEEALMSVSRENVEDIVAKGIGKDESAKNSQEHQLIRMEYADYEITPEQAKHWEEERKTYHEREKKMLLRRRIIAVLSTAACICILCVVGFQYHEYRATIDLGNQYAAAFVAEQKSSIRGVNNKASKELARLYLNVQDGVNLEATIRHLTVLWEVSTMDIYNDYTDDASLIGWNLAIAYLKSNNKDAAKEVLVKLISTTESGNAVNLKAKELQKKLY